MKKITLLFCLYSFFITDNLLAQTAKLWGMTPIGGQNGGGVIFKINLGGSGYTTIYSFNPDTAGGGSSPEGDLFNASNGKLYGTALYGGLHTNTGGCIFSFSPADNSYSDVYDFSQATGYQSNGSLIEAANGDLYGMATGGGAYNLGVIFRFNPDSNTYADVHDFDSTHGSYPYGNLMLTSDGKMYGMAQFGGSADFGVIFIFDPSTNSFTDLYDFTGTNGSYPYGSLIQSGNKLYGLTADGGTSNGVIFNYNISSNTFTKLYDFNYDSGGSPDGSLIQLSNGILYGATNSGGTNNDGVIFSFDTTTNTYHDKFNFNGTLGQSPPSGLLLASDGNLYGMAYYGGAKSDGVIFSYNLPDSTCTDLHDFDSTLGGRPNGNLIETGASGINTLSVNNTQLLIYPNPASQQLTVISRQTSVNEIRIENMLGQTVLDYTLATNNGFGIKRIIDISILPAGMYFVSVISENSIATGKVIVK